MPVLLCFWILGQEILQSSILAWATVQYPCLKKKRTNKQKNKKTTQDWGLAFWSLWPRVYCILITWEQRPIFFCCTVSFRPAWGMGNHLRIRIKIFPNLPEKMGQWPSLCIDLETFILLGLGCPTCCLHVLLDSYGCDLTWKHTHLKNENFFCKFLWLNYAVFRWLKNYAYFLDDN